MDAWGIGPPPEPEEEETRADVLRIILYELNTAIAPRDARLEAIRSALREFDHRDERLHDEELDLQADRILFQKLAFARSVDCGGNGNSGEEVDLICSALEMVYRASRSVVALSFAEVGEAMLPILVDVVRHPNPNRIPDKSGGLADEQDQERQQDLQQQLEQQQLEQQQLEQQQLEQQQQEKIAEPEANVQPEPSEAAELAAEAPPCGSGLDAAASAETPPPPKNPSPAAEPEPAEPAAAAPLAPSAASEFAALKDSIRAHDLEAAAYYGRSEQLQRHGEEKKADSSADLLPAESLSESASGASGSPLLVNGLVPSGGDGYAGMAQLVASAGGTEETAGGDYGAAAASATDGGGTASQPQHGGEQRRDEDQSHDDDEEELADSEDDGDGLYVGWAKRADDVSEQLEGQEPKRRSQVRFWDEAGEGGSASGSQRRGDAEGEDEDEDEDDVPSRPPDLAVGKVLKVLRYYSRVLSAMTPMARYPGLLDALVYQMGRRRRARMRFHDSITDDIPWAASPRTASPEELSSIRIDAIATIVNLACAEENKTMMVQHPGLLDAILRTANEDSSEEAREHAAIVLMNIAYAEENKVYMASQDQLLDTLAHLLGDKSPFTRRYASASLFTLACVAANTARIARHRDGLILDALSKVLLEDPIDEARVNSAEACFNMAKNNSDDTIELMGSHPDLLPVLAHAVMADLSQDVRSFAARTLEWLAADIHHGMPCHGSLLGALTKASLWTKTTCIAEALQSQALVTENRAAMIRHDGLLDALASLALLEGMSDEEVRNCAVATLVELSKEESMRVAMAKNEGVMTALTRATFLSRGGSSGAAGTGYDGIMDSGADVGFGFESKTEGPTSATKIALKNLANAL